MQMYLVLGLLIFMIVMFFTHKVPYGVTTMTCCVVLALTGVFQIQEAFSGLANKTTILIACMFTIAVITLVISANIFFPVYPAV